MILNSLNQSNTLFSDNKQYYTEMTIFWDRICKITDGSSIAYKMYKCVMHWQNFHLHSSDSYEKVVTNNALRT